MEAGWAWSRDGVCRRCGYRGWNYTRGEDALCSLCRRHEEDAHLSALRFRLRRPDGSMAATIDTLDRAERVARALDDEPEIAIFDTADKEQPEHRRTFERGREVWRG